MRRARFGGLFAFQNRAGVRSVNSLPPCPECGGPNDWDAVSCGDSTRDPYPDS